MANVADVYGLILITQKPLSCLVVTLITFAIPLVQFILMVLPNALPV